jgi:hypothetical protein
MAQTYKQAITEGRRLYNEAMDVAAAHVLYVVAEFGKPRKTVCREIAGDEGFNALDHRARAIEKTAGQTPDEARVARQRATERKQVSAARQALKDPEQAAKVLGGDSKAREVALEAIGKAEGQTRARPPKVNDEAIWGPFQKLGQELERVRKHLPDVAPKEFLEDAEDIINQLRMTADVIDKWTRGESFADEIEDYLKGVS